MELKVAYLSKLQLHKINKIKDNLKNTLINQALKYKHLWTVEYGMLPDCGGEEYDKSAKIV